MKEDPTAKYICIRMDPDDILKAYFLIHHLPKEATLKPEEGVFSGGYYVGTFTLLPTYPYFPPQIRFLTPSGRFVINHPICFTYSNYYPDDWTPDIRLFPCLIALVYWMCDFSDYALLHSIGGIKTSYEEKLSFAEQSLDYNIKNIPMFKTLFPEFCTQKTPMNTD